MRSKHLQPSVNKKPIAAIVVVLAGLLLSLHSTQASSAPNQIGVFKHLSVPGGIAIVDLGISSDKSKPNVKLGSRNIAVVEEAGQWYGIVGVGLTTEPGTKTLKVNSAGASSKVNFQVDDLQYKEQHIVIKDKSKVNPAPLDMKRIKKENKRVAEVKAYAYKTLLSDRFQLPLEGILTSPFGLKRFYNGQARRPHGGIDIAADTGTPIYAPATGLVVETGDYFFNGNCIFIEHGLGLQTFYAHLSKINVKPGDKVYAGDLLGEVGATGRVTGPHLHWSVGLNGTWVNPNLLLDN